MAENVERDTASWQQVNVTVYFTLATSAIFLVVFEMARRIPAISAVYDKRRRMQKRTIPPLLKSPFEWLFLSTETSYTTYADILYTQQVLAERKRQQEAFGRKHGHAITNEMTTNNKTSATTDTKPQPGEEESLPQNQNHASRAPLPDKSHQRGGANVDQETNSTKDSSSDNQKQKKTTPTTMVDSALTPDVVVVNGRRLHITVVQEVDIWNLSDEQLDTYQQELLALEQESERLFRERYKSVLAEQGLRAELAKQKKKPQKPPRGGGGADTAIVPRTGITNNNNNKNDDDDVVDLTLIVPPSRWRYIGFTTLSSLPFYHNPDGTTASAKKQSVRVAGTRGFIGQESLSLLRTVASTELVDEPPDEVDSVIEEYTLKNQYLKSVSDKVTRPLSATDEELLRVIGLDAFVMVRFLRFGFDTSFYPFLVAMVMLIPTYYTNDYDGDNEVETSGYFRFTFRRLEAESRRLWVPWTFAVLFFSYVLFRIYVEWEVFVALRSDFIANGDADMDDDFVLPTIGSPPSGGGGGGADLERQQKAADLQAAQKSLIQYRNSCLVEYIPPSHQSDQGLFEFFDAIFPKQVERAEILMKADSLTKLIAKRQQLIIRYENVYAQYFHVHQKHRRTVEQIKANEGSWQNALCCRTCRGLPPQPSEPMVRVSGRCCRRKMVKTLPHIKAEINKLNVEIEAEHARITEAKKKVDESVSKRNILSRAVGKGLQYVTGQEQHTCSTGFVEFKNLSTKQNALQCNISGTTHFMTMVSAPDPRDLNWDNAGEARSNLQWKLYTCRVLLFVGTLFWFFVVAFVTSISNLQQVSKYVPSYLIPKEGTYWYNTIQGYLPVLALEFVMYFVPILLRMIATRYIRLKTNSEVDRFVFGWHFAYRLANLIIVIVKNEVLTLESVRNDVRGTLVKVAEGVAMSSQFFMNNMIATAGSGMWELAQMPNVIIHFITYRIVTVEAKSKRALEKLEEPSSFEWGDVFPTFIFSFLVATTYATTVPFILGVCAVYFYLTTKVYIHQALYVYVQPYEGGGKLMYILNRTLFIILYFSIALFGMLLALKKGRIESPTFFFPMILLTAFIDWLIHTKFVAPSIALNLTNARIIDNEERVRLRQLKKRRREEEAKYEEYIFRQPQLNKLVWETKPQPYR